MINRPILFLGNIRPSLKGRETCPQKLFHQENSIMWETDYFAGIRAQGFTCSSVGFEGGTIRSLQHLAALRPQEGLCIASPLSGTVHCRPLLSSNLQEAAGRTRAELWREKNLGSNPSPVQLSPFSPYDLGEVDTPFLASASVSAFQD